MVEYITRRQDILSRMKKIMGDLPLHSDNHPIAKEIINTEVIGNVIRQRIRYSDEPESFIPAYLMIPVKIDKPVPGIICLHQTTQCGSKEPAGVEGKPNLFYAIELAQRGYITLAPDLPSFGDLKNVNPLPEGYVSGTMKDINLHCRGLDLLSETDGVDAQRLACIGHSLGGHNALFLAAFDSRVKVAATSCGFTTWEAYAENAGDLSAWAQDRYMPRIRDIYHNNPSEMPVLFEEILEAILPGAIYINAPVKDAGMPKKGVDVCVDYIRKISNETGLPLNLLVEHPDCGHDFPAEQRENCYNFIDKQLKN